MPLYSDLGLYYTSHLTATPSYYSSPFLGSSGRSPTLGLGLLPPPRVLPRVSPILPSIPESSCFSTSRARTALDRSQASRYIPPPPSTSRYKPLHIDTADIDVSSNRYNGLSGSHALGSEPDRQNTIKRGRTVVRIHTKKFKENPALDAKRKMTPGEKLMQKFLILDKAEEEAKAARRKRLEEQEIKEREEAEVARLQAMAAAKSAAAAESPEMASDSDSADSSSVVQNFPKIGGMTENAALDILLSAAEDDEPASGGEITRSGSTGTVKRRKTKDREGTVKLAKKKTKRRPSVDSSDAVQSPAEDIPKSTPGDELLERSTLQRRNTVRFRRNSQDTEAFPEVESIAGSRRSSIDPGSRRSSFDQVVSDSRRSSLDSTTGDEITQPNEMKSTVKKRKCPKNRIVVANVSVDIDTTSALEPPSPKFIVDEVKVEQSASPRPVGKAFRYEVIVEDIEGEKTAPKHGKSAKAKGGQTKKKKSFIEKTAFSKSVDKSSSDSSTDIEAAAKGENKDSTLKSFQKSHDAKAEGTVKQNAKTKTEENKAKSKEIPKNNVENLTSQKPTSDDNEFNMKKISKQEVTLEKENQNNENLSSGEKHGQKTTQEDNVLTDKTKLTQKSLLSDAKQKSQANIEKKKDPPNINKTKLEKTKQVKRQADPLPVLSSSPPETEDANINFWAYLNGSVNEEKVLRKPVLPKEQPINSDNKTMTEEIKSSLSGALNIRSDLSRKENEEEKEAIKGVTEVRVIKTNKDANSKQKTEVSKVDRKKKVSPKDKAIEKQSTSVSAEKLMHETKSASNIPQQPQNLGNETLKTIYSESLVTVKNDKNATSLKTPSAVNSKSLVDNKFTQTQMSSSEVFSTKKGSEETTKIASSVDAVFNAEKLPKNNLLKNPKDVENKTSNNLEEKAVPKWKLNLPGVKVVEPKKPPLAKMKQGSGDTSNEVITTNINKRDKFSAAGGESKFIMSSVDVMSEQVPTNIQQFKMEVKNLLYLEPEAKLLGNIEPYENKKSFSKDSFKKDKTSSVTSVILPKQANEKSEEKKEDRIKLAATQKLEYRKKEEENPSCSSSESENVPEESTETKDKLPSGNLISKNEYLCQQKSKGKNSVESSDEKSKSGEGNSKVDKIGSGLNGKKNKLFEQKSKTEEKSQTPTVGKKGKLLEQTKKDDRDPLLPLANKQNTVEMKSLVQVEPSSNEKGPKLIPKSKEEVSVEVQPTLKKEAKLSPQKNKNDKTESTSINNCAQKNKRKNSAQKREEESTETSSILTKTAPKLTPSKGKESEVNNDPTSTIQKKNAQKNRNEVLNDDAAAQKTTGAKKVVKQKSKDDLPKDDKITRDPIKKKLVAQKIEDDLKKTKPAMQKSQSSSAVTKKHSPQKSKEETPKDTTISPPVKKLVTQKSKEDSSKDQSPLLKPPLSTAVAKKQANQKSKEEPLKEPLPAPKKVAQKSKEDPVQDTPATEKSPPKKSCVLSGDVKPTVPSHIVPTAAKAPKTPNQKSTGVTKSAKKVELAVTAVTEAVENAAARAGAESGSDADSEDSSGDEGESTTPRNSSTSSSGGSSSGSGTASSDSGFDSRPSSVPVSSTASEAGIGAREPGSPAPAYAFSPTLDPYSEDVGLLRGSSASASGRTTPPATSLPRFRKYTVDDFQFLKLLGKGTFGKVLLAELRGTDRHYAVKCLKKDVVLEDDDVECTLIERKVLALGTKHPYLCHLFCTFQTESHLLFVMEYLNGGDLMFHIQQSGRFPEPRARFYAAEIVCGLKFLHKKGIVYRDLKLDNILLDYQGHVRIADFGMCKLQIFLDRTADTFCGTPDYMAPEIIKGLKYNQCVDWWSFGVLVFEMLVGVSPFSGCDEDELFWSICNEQPQYPRFLSREAHSLLVALLEKDALKRLGTPDSPKGDVPDHLFFRSVDWGALERRELEPPFTPRVKHPLDVQYFDTAFTAERPELTPVDASILQSMDQAQFQGFSYTNPNATD